MIRSRLTVIDRHSIRYAKFVRIAHDIASRITYTSRSWSSYSDELCFTRTFKQYLVYVTYSSSSSGVAHFWELVLESRISGDSAAYSYELISASRREPVFNVMPEYISLIFTCNLCNWLLFCVFVYLHHGDTNALSIYGWLKDAQIITDLIDAIIALKHWFHIIIRHIESGPNYRLQIVTNGQQLTTILNIIRIIDGLGKNDYSLWEKEDSWWGKI